MRAGDSNGASGFFASGARKRSQFLPASAGAGQGAFAWQYGGGDSGAYNSFL